MTTEISDLTGSAVPVVQPAGLRGDLTAIVKNGHSLHVVPFGEINQDAVRQIIESSFIGDKLVQDYFAGKAQAGFLVEEAGQGVAVLLRDYLDILAVAEPYQGNGVGKALMEFLFNQ